METFDKIFDVIVQAAIVTFTGVREVTQDDYALCGPRK